MKRPTQAKTRAAKDRSAGREDDSVRPLTAVEATRAKANFPGMKLIPWSEIWSSLKVARARGDGKMIEVFYETLYKEAVFDDRGAWSLETRRPR
ncbi:MAG TPA: hypothetical protein VNN77_00545 [candidate division Zixibacteria bacterium]|nr:hypothetical protein [candidate division Zixibacteria bacterium]